MTHGLTEPGMEGRGTRRGAFRRRCTEARGQKNNTPSTLHGDGTQARDFTYVDDVARGTVLAGQFIGGRAVVGCSQPGAGSQFSLGEIEAGMAEGGSQTSDVSRQPSVPGYNVINLGGGNNPVSLNSIIGWIEKELSIRSSVLGGGPVSRRAVIDQRPSSAADVQETWADISKARRLLGWEPQVPPEEGFLRAIKWHCANRDWLRDIKL